MRTRFITFELLAFLTKISATTSSEESEPIESENLFKGLVFLRTLLKESKDTTIPYFEYFSINTEKYILFHKIASANFESFQKKLMELGLQIEEVSQLNKAPFDSKFKEIISEWNNLYSTVISKIPNEINLLNSEFFEYQNYLRKYSFIQKYLKIVIKISKLAVSKNNPEISSQENAVFLDTKKIDKIIGLSKKLRQIIDQYVEFSSIIKEEAELINNSLNEIEAGNSNNLDLKWCKENFDQIFSDRISCFEKDTKEIQIMLESLNELNRSLFSEIETSGVLTEKAVTSFLKGDKLFEIGESNESDGFSNSYQSEECI